MLFIYNNIHNYELKKDPNPFTLNQSKSTQQVRFEMLQDKLKQNNIIYQYKKALNESNKRIPGFLQRLDQPEKNSDLI